MLFNSFRFLIFFIIVYIVYLVLKHKWQNRLLLVASYIFYGAWDYRFLGLILLSTVTDYFCGLGIQRTQDTSKRNTFLILSLVINLGILGFFKYFNFFSHSLSAFFTLIGLEFITPSLDIVLPVGISFYTFQTLSYTIDIYRKKIEPTSNFLDFALFVSFFPQLVAGPIERAKNLLPQVLNPRKVNLDCIWSGLHLIIWGLFLKCFVADNLAHIVDPVFSGNVPSGSVVLITAYSFAFQIFGDFAGYSCIARGIAKLMGFDIMLNFNIPYLATSFRDFWHRWHISLSTWLRDYLYIPLGGNRKGKLREYLNIMITMVLGGLWHGANWTFLIWGFVHGLLLILNRILDPLLAGLPNRGMINNILFFCKIVFVFNIVSLCWILFRSQSILQAFELLKSIFFSFDVSDCFILLRPFISYTGILIVVQFIQYKRGTTEIFKTFHPIIQGLLLGSIAYLTLIFGVDGGQEFIYFQF